MRSIPDRRFGERLRSEQRKNPGCPVRLFPDEAEAIAAAIDQDAERQHDADCAGISGLLRGQRIDLRQQVEEAVERLRYSVGGFPGTPLETLRDVLDVEPFLAELGRIFGDRQERPPWTWTLILETIAISAGWKPDRFIEEYGNDGFALERFLEAEEARREADDELSSEHEADSEGMQV